MKQRDIKAIAKINIFLDDDRKKLSDKMHNYELSHNRNDRLLKAIKKELQKINTNTKEYLTRYICIKLERKIEEELHSTLRVRY